MDCGGCGRLMVPALDGNGPRPHKLPSQQRRHALWRADCVEVALGPRKEDDRHRAVVID
jgi:hypothetical protein